MTKKEALSKIIKIKDLEKKADKLNEEIEGLQNDLKKWMDQCHYQEKRLDIFKVSYKTVVINKFDVKAFKSEYGGLYDMYVKPIESKRFTVSA